MNNEPVAWMSQGGDVSRSADYFVEMGFTDLIPLYTHPHSEESVKVKELTDEEIYQTWVEAKNTALNTKGNFVEVLFARAILRKAQEK
jgi:hypothetical protein